jgi:hypothetical protein
MDNPVPAQVSITVNPAFWEHYIASFSGLSTGRFGSLAVFPLIGLVVMFIPSTVGNRPALERAVFALAAMGFIPARNALMVWRFRANKVTQGPFHFRFDSVGIHTTGAAFNQTVKWAAVLRVRQTKLFLFFFVTPTKAISVSLKELRDQGALEGVRQLASEHADFG